MILLMPPKMSIKFFIFHFLLPSTTTIHQQVSELSFFTGRGGRLSVMAGRQFFLVPPFAYGGKFWSPLSLRRKILVPPFDLVKKFWSPPPHQGERAFPPYKQIRVQWSDEIVHVMGVEKNVSIIMWTCYVLWSLVKKKVAPQARIFFE